MDYQQPDVRGRGPRERAEGKLSTQKTPRCGVAAPSLLDAKFEHDACGVGFVASAKGKPSHTILQQALTALARLAHRGAVATDGKTSDGVGLMTGIPRKLLLSAAGITLAEGEELGVGMMFIPQGETRAEEVLERAIVAQEMRVLGWRDVPVDTSVLGAVSLETLPKIRQVLIADAARTEDTSEDWEGPFDPCVAGLNSMDRRLYLARKQFERAVHEGEVEGYACSLSSRTIVYKALCLGSVMAEFYPDLASPKYVTNFAIFHQRYATNTLPAWHRAQPSRKLGHNGEINTVWGNRARMKAREMTLPVESTPVFTPGGTDSTSLDEAIEMLSFNGRTIAESVRMLMPPAVTEKKHPFLEYHKDCSEPWDGPAAIAFADGVVVGAALDRNGLRPCRYAITSDGTVVAGSEAGLVDLNPEMVIESGRLGPGQMIGVDMREQRIYRNEDMMDAFDAKFAYGTLINAAPLDAVEADVPLAADALARAQRGFGYTQEDVKMILPEMASTGKDLVWSMGDDAPLAFLARSPRPLYAFFRQRFAQVTNPAIDPLREAVVVSLHTRMGPWAHMLDKHAPLPGIWMESPFLSLGQVRALRMGAYPRAEELRLEVLPCVFAAASSLESGIDALCGQALELVRNGARLLLLTDRDATTEQVPVPMAMATGAVHQALVQAGLRTLCGLVVEAGDCRDIHHAAVLIGFGAGVVCPWLALETARSLSSKGGTKPEGADPEQQMLHALDLGLAKVMSKMGISVVDSYRGAGLFDILGLHSSIVDRCFPGTPAPISGIGFAEVERRLRIGWQAETKDLPERGWVRYRKAEGAEPHMWQPPTVKLLQTAMGSTKAGGAPENVNDAFRIFENDLDGREAQTLRDLLEIVPAGAPKDLREVQSPEEICKKFVASAMSLGSLSPEAHTTITEAMNWLGARSNTGEGGEDPIVYREAVLAEALPSVSGGSGATELASEAAQIPMPAELKQSVSEPLRVYSRNNKIKQIASGRFGVTAEYLAHAEEIEIKVAQGAKPGEGGQLPGHKVSALIARLRHAQPGVPLISPPPHHDIYSIEDLAQLIYDLKRVNPRAAVGVKLVSGCGVGTVAAGVAKAYADYIVIAGNTGGTGAAALSSIKYAGNPWELGLAEAQQALMANGMRDRVRLRTDGGLATAKDVLIAALLGADEYAFGTAVLVALGCDMARQCHAGTCPTGIATQNEELRKRFRGKPEHVVTFFQQLASEVQRLLAKFGLASLEDAVGRVDLLQQVRYDGELDLSAMLAKPPHWEEGAARRWMGVHNTRPGVDEQLDEQWVAPAMAAALAGEPFYARTFINNAHRAVGARLGGVLGIARAKGEVDAVDMTFDLTGTAGQSFGAFAPEGMTLLLTGQANDFVGKGLSGATLVLRPVGLAAVDSAGHTLLGNVALYGATAGRLFAAGRAGERFAVRNSGVTTVVEGVGDHGCEYMTGGVAVILGEVGINFGAGMTGGTAWVLDAKQRMIAESRYHTEFLEATPFADATAEQRAALKALLEEHVRLARSVKATALLANWVDTARDFVLFTPKPQ